jgi:5-oxopent-3-ene-1,2,5-tricarboxylate decarboxylase/2-hydroxyhepta-2,4-diene-1,7-dioate isomerase
VLHGGEPAWGRFEEGEVVLDSGERLDPGTVDWLPPAVPTKIVAVSLSYRSRIAELGGELPEQPRYFLEPPSSLNGHLATLPRPAGTELLNYEGELAVVIGTRMKGVPEDRALDHVAGFTCANDVGLHDFHHSDGGSLLRVKGLDGYLPLGPALVSPDEWSPEHGYVLRTLLNGTIVQEGTHEDALWPVSYLLADICRLITLEPGDVVLTGTPANSRPMRPGDAVSVEIEGLSRLDNRVVDWEVELAALGEQPRLSPIALRVALALSPEEAERQASLRGTGTPGPAG